MAGEAFLTTRVRRGQLLRLLLDLKGLGDARTRRRLNFLVASFAEARASLGQMRVKVSDELLRARRALRALLRRRPLLCLISKHIQQQHGFWRGRLAASLAVLGVLHDDLLFGLGRDQIGTRRAKAER